MSWPPSQRWGQRCQFNCARTSRGQVTSDVKGVGCGVRGLWRVFLRRATHRALIFPGGLNSEKTYREPCIRSCSAGVKWTIPVGTPGHLHRTRPCTSAFPARPSLTRTRCRGGSGSPPESWRRRGLEHGIHHRRGPSRSDQAERDRCSDTGDCCVGITQLIIGAAPRLRDDGDNAPGAAGTGPVRPRRAHTQHTRTDPIDQ